MAINVKSNSSQKTIAVSGDLSNYATKNDLKGYATTASLSSYATTSAMNTAINNVKLAMFPVGAIYISATNTNPSTFIGGTWEQFGQGRTLIGAGTGNDGHESRSFNVNATGGEYKHNHAYAIRHGEWYGMMPSGNFQLGTWSRTSTGGTQMGWTTSANNNETFSANVYSNHAQQSGNVAKMQVSGNTSYNDNQKNNALAVPYIVTYFWKRTK